MHSSHAILHRPALLSLALSACLTLGACSGDANPVRDTLVSVGAGPTVAPTPDFVERSRPATLDYVPVGTAAPERPVKARSADEVKAVEAEMEGLRTRNEAAARAAEKAGATPAPEPATIAPPAAPVPVRKPAPRKTP